ncbi:MAG TPA: hypothetical protein VJ715_03210 [Pyrinomonadaceae bacterium]|nr:hypothetical protein [Pyrinomonadaceae bacterium]
MNLPGFTAEAALGLNADAQRQYRSALTGETHASNARVVPSFNQQQTSGCGPCMELKWPNGTGTGACVKYCCNALGCEMVSCTCRTTRPGGPITI